jgi:hypothetical protein
LFVKENFFAALKRTPSPSNRMIFAKKGKIGAHVKSPFYMDLGI